MNLLRITVAVLLAVLVLPLQADEPGYVGAETCGSCHAEAFSDWQKSHHFHAMQPADEETISQCQQLAEENLRVDVVFLQETS